MILELKNILVTKFEMNNAKFEGEIKLESNINQQNQYNEEEKIIISNTDLTIETKDVDFRIYIEMETVTKFEGDFDKEFADKEIIKLVYPYIQAYIITATSNAGIPPLLLPNFFATAGK